MVILFSIKQSLLNPIAVITANVQDIAEGDGDLTKRLAVRKMDEMGVLATGFNSFLDKLQVMIKDISKNSSVISGSSTALLELAGQLSGGAQQMTESSTLVSSSAGRSSVTGCWTCRR